jgi:hypothetical protein
LYRIDSRFDGFTPEEIPNRAQNNYLTCNWNQYFDEVTRGDIIFTFFIGSNQPRGIYLIAKVKFPNRNEVKAKVLDFTADKPIVSQDDIAKYLPMILNRPRGSVFAVPPFLDAIFDRILHDRISSDIEISEDIDCYSCFEKKEFPCDTCSIFDWDYFGIEDNGNLSVARLNARQKSYKLNCTTKTSAQLTVRGKNLGDRTDFSKEHCKEPESFDVSVCLPTLPLLASNFLQPCPRRRSS